MNSVGLFFRGTFNLAVFALPKIPVKERGRIRRRYGRLHFGKDPGDVVTQPPKGFTGTWHGKLIRYLRSARAMCRKKSAYQSDSERKFLRDRSPKNLKGYIGDFTEQDFTAGGLGQLRGSVPKSASGKSGSTKGQDTMKKVFNIANASGHEITSFRKSIVIQKLRKSEPDTGSLGVQIGCVTEKILGLREHMLRVPKDRSIRARMQIYLSRRIKLMRRLYKADIHEYLHVCRTLKLRAIRFAIPLSKHVSRGLSPAAVDGEKALWLARQRAYEGRYRPKVHKEEVNGKTINVYRGKYPLTKPPSSWNKPRPVGNALNANAPHGFRDSWLQGKHPVLNPTAPGKGHVPGSLVR